MPTLAARLPSTRTHFLLIPFTDVSVLPSTSMRFAMAFYRPSPLTCKHYTSPPPSSFKTRFPTLLLASTTIYLFHWLPTGYRHSCCSLSTHCPPSTCHRSLSTHHRSLSTHHHSLSTHRRLPSTRHRSPSTHHRFPVLLLNSTYHRHIMCEALAAARFQPIAAHFLPIAAPSQLITTRPLPITNTCVKHSPLAARCPHPILYPPPLAFYYSLPTTYAQLIVCTCCFLALPPICILKVSFKLSLNLMHNTFSVQMLIIQARYRH